MLMVLIALMPATFFGIYNFGTDAFLLIVCTTAAAVLSEYLYEKLIITDHHRRFQCGRYRFAACVEPAADTSDLDGNFRCRVCDHRGKTVVWRSGTELYEPGTGCKMFPFDLFHEKNDLFCI